MPRMTIAISVGQHLEPELGVDADVIGTAIPISASDGMARPRFAALIAKPAAAPRVPDPQADRQRDGAGDQQRGERQRDVLAQSGPGSRSGPDQLARDSVSQAMVSLMIVMPAVLRRDPLASAGLGARRRRPRAPRHGVSAAPDPERRQVDGDRQEHRRHGAEQHLRGEEVAVALEDEEAEAAEPVADRAGDRRRARSSTRWRPGGRRRSAAVAERQLDPPQPLRGAVAHAVGRLERRRAGTRVEARPRCSGRRSGSCTGRAGSPR